MIVINRNQAIQNLTTLKNVLELEFLEGINKIDIKLINSEDIEECKIQIKYKKEIYDIYVYLDSLNHFGVTCDDEEFNTIASISEVLNYFNEI